MLGIALDCSEVTNGMIFYNPDLDSFFVSADYPIDKKRHIGEAFSSIQYDWGLTTKVLSNKKNGLTKYDIGDSVFIQCQDTYDILSGLVAMPRTSKTDTYTIKLDHRDNEIEVKHDHIYSYLKNVSVSLCLRVSVSVPLINPEHLKIC